ncbi:uncharacterized protein MELLADRAFT_58750 [Melampsora larici-populina 98AG31]|uniref:Secreted protein n=1 Tax=Melampsora larici-populina (strain 98AG31 / pathotype 3-4-7) TaxID=747676 RepID=F4R4Q0_MELLP|nr:uncharacterized protein MELLADRAFT_58750 [Melampsora larici-populina 98AG31]EGG12961.1 secreted protein [Melampsora larici-populina 98AG31]
MFKTLASCATLGLLALTTSAAPQAYADLRPTVIGAKTFFINTKIDFTRPAEVLDSTGRVVHMIQPLSTSGEEFIQIVSTTDPLDIALVKVEKPSDCSAISARYFFYQSFTYGKPNPPRGQWILDPTDHAKFSPVFLRSPKGSPSGKILLVPSSSIVLAKISDYHHPPTTLPAGHYYSIFFPARGGNSPYIEELTLRVSHLTQTDAIALLVKILEDQNQCT